MAKVTYNNHNAVFAKALKSDVERYFTENGIRKTGTRALYIKSAVLLPIPIIIYIFLLTQHYNGFLGVALSLLLGFSLATIGFNIMHDACHGSYSTRKWVNELMGLTLNALGGNAFIWKLKHNVIHHTYTNVDGLDDDIAKTPYIRMAQTQAWKPAHRVQHIYLWGLYALSSFLWIVFIDVVKYFNKKVNNTPLGRMSVKEHTIFWVSKVLYVVFYVAIPVYAVGWEKFLIGFACMHVALGLSLSVVFQLAHVIEETDFEFTGAEGKTIENEWAIHQVKTTANFSPNSKVISWLVGGLNYQVEHHLFPKVSHVHYPAISGIVAKKCEEFGLKYHSLPTMRVAIASHYRFMKMLSKKPEQQMA